MWYDTQSSSAQRQAREQFRSLHGRAIRRKLWSALTGRRHRLLSLREVQKPKKARQVRSYAGLRLVPIVQIRGSEGRGADFDVDFRPLKTHNQERWIRMAVAHSLDVGLPAVELVQVNDSYFVRDGHHRISVAKMMGQQEIEAEVTEWRGATLPEHASGTAIAQAAALGATQRDRLLNSRWMDMSKWLATLGEKWQAHSSSDSCTPALHCGQ